MGAKKRIAWIDIAKGIAIILVIIGHTLDKLSYARHIIFSFHMPLFFILAGYTMRPKPMKQVLESSVKRLLIPYLLIFVAWWGAMLLWSPDAFTAATLSDYAGRLVYASGFDVPSGIGASDPKFPAVGVAWFLVALFCARLIVNAGLLAQKRFNISHWAMGIIFFVLAAIGEYLGDEMRLFLPLSLDVAFVASFLMWCGYFAKESQLIHKLARNKWMILVAVVIWVLALKYSNLEMSERVYSMYILCIAGAISATYLVCWLSKFIDLYIKGVNRFLAWAGENSMLIYNIHCVDWLVPWMSLPALASVPMSHFVAGIARCVCDFSLAEVFKKA